MKFVRFSVGLVLVLFIGEVIARLAAITTPRTVAKPYSTLEVPGNSRFRFINDRGNQSRVDRGAPKRVGIFSNSSSMGEVSQEKMWPELLQQEFPDVHFENNATAGARFSKMYSLLSEAVRREEKYDVLIVVLDLQPLRELPEEVAFTYSKRYRSCDNSSSCLLARLRMILDHQEKSDPIYKSVRPILRDALISSARAVESVQSESIFAREVKSECYHYAIPHCQDMQIKAREKAKKEATSRGLENISRAEKEVIYQTVFEPCAAEVDRRCEIRRNPNLELHAIHPDEVSSIVDQLHVLQGLAKRLSGRVIYVASPFAFSDALDPMNISSVHHVEWQSNFGGTPYYTNKNIARQLERYNRILRLGLEKSGVPTVEVQGPVDQIGRDEIAYASFGHLSGLGHRVVKDIFSAELRKVGLIEMRGPSSAGDGVR